MGNEEILMVNLDKNRFLTVNDVKTLTRDLSVRNRDTSILIASIIKDTTYIPAHCNMNNDNGSYVEGNYHYTDTVLSNLASKLEDDKNIDILDLLCIPDNLDLIEGDYLEVYLTELINTIFAKHCDCGITIDNFYTDFIDLYNLSNTNDTVRHCINYFRQYLLLLLEYSRYGFIKKDFSNLDIGLSECKSVFIITRENIIYNVGIAPVFNMLKCNGRISKDSELGNKILEWMKNTTNNKITLYTYLESQVGEKKSITLYNTPYDYIKVDSFKDE